MDEGLTENEGSLLGLVHRYEPMTAYQIVKFYEESPTTTINSSKGSVYPMIRRLTERGLLRTQKVRGDRRNSETIGCTAAGRAAVKKWVKGLRPDHTLIGDPMRTRLLSLDLLSREEQIEWVVDAKALMLAKQAELEAYARTVSVPFQDIVHASAVSAIEDKVAWLDRLLHKIVKSEPSRPRA